MTHVMLNRIQSVEISGVCPTRSNRPRLVIEHLDGPLGQSAALFTVCVAPTTAAVTDPSDLAEPVLV